MTAVVAGAGLAGLSAALALGGRARVFEREDRPGGLCRTWKWRGFTVDHAAHYLHFRDAEVRRLVMGLLRGNTVRLPRDSWVCLRGIYTRYPFQANTYGHDPLLIRECLVGFAKARAAGVPARRGESYEDWIRRTWGEGFLRHFMRPFNEKQFHTRLSDLLPLQGGRFLPRPDRHEIVRGALARSALPRTLRVAKAGPGGYNAVLMHPKRGGIEELAKAMTARLAAPPVTGAPLVRVRWKERTAEFRGHGRVPWDALVSTLPLPALIGLLDPLPPSLARVRARLRWVGVRCLHYLVRRPPERRRHWIYVPERRFPFFRVGLPSNMNPADAPRGMGVVSAEVAYAPGRRPPLAHELARSRRGLTEIGMLGRGSRIVREVAFDMPCAYVVFDRAYPAARRFALRWLADRNILSIGRYGGWVYGGMEDAIREGLDTGRLVAAYGARSGARFRVEDQS